MREIAGHSGEGVASHAQGQGSANSDDRLATVATAGRLLACTFDALIQVRGRMISNILFELSTSKAMERAFLQ
jgi:hypothetical protein